MTSARVREVRNCSASQVAVAKAQHKGLGSSESAAQASKTLKKRGCSHWCTEMLPAVACKGLVAFTNGLKETFRAKRR